VKKAVIIGVLLMTVVSGTAFGQIEQIGRKRSRIDQSLRTAEDVENERRAEEQGRLPAPKPAVLNVDVQIVLSKADVKTFAEAKLAEAKRVLDGDRLWMYVKFKSKLGDYVITSRDPDDREKLHYKLYAEVAPKGESAALHQITIEFAKEDLAATELKIGLAPAVFGRNKSLPLFLMMTGTTRSGVWNNDVRLTNNLNMPRALTDNLAIAPVVLDLSAGSTKYRKMESEYDSIVIRGTADVKKMPIAGSFVSDQLKVRLMERLAAEKIEPGKVYFSGDERQEFASFTPSLKKARKVFATFTYQTGEACFYGVAEILETFDLLQMKYGEPDFRFEKGLPIACSEVN
jgi:hypothetical protein